MQPIRFAKAHPLAVVVSGALGMMVGPWILGVVRGLTGVGVSLPSVGNSDN
jgi:hypothetical protein